MRRMEMILSVAFCLFSKSSGRTDGNSRSSILDEVYREPIFITSISKMKSKREISHSCQIMSSPYTAIVQC